MTMEAEFSRIVRSGAWGCPETPCGPGSTLEACKDIIRVLPQWVTRFKIRSIVDAGCGDFHWMSRVDLSGITYNGFDIVPEMIQKNKELHAKENIHFHHADILEAPLKGDLILCKDVLSHLPTQKALAALECIRSSGSRYLAASTWLDWPAQKREGMPVGAFCPMDMERPPFSLGAPIEAVSVPMKAGNPEKRFALWRLEA